MTKLGRLVGVIDASGNAAAYHYDEVGNLTAITRSTPTQVAIIEFTPNGGAGGQTVTIHGTGFSASPSSNTVTFNGTGATVNTATTTTLTVTVPSSATTGTISVTSPNGSTNSSAPFVVAPAASIPTITGFSPAIGVAGTAVTVTGTNFDPVLSLNRLVLNAKYASVTSAATTSLATSIAAAVSSGRFVLRTPAGTATSTDDFFVVPSPYGASDVASTGRLQFSSAFNLQISTASKIGLVVFDGTSGRRISLKVVPGPNSTIKLYNPNTSVHATHSTGVLTSLMEPPLLSATGTYQFMLDPTGTGTGTTALTLYDVPADFSGTITPGGSPVNVVVTTPGQNGVLTFSGTASQRVSVKVSPGPNATVSLRRPDGFVQASVVSGAVTTLMEPQTLATTDTYSLKADFTGIATGTITLTHYDVPADTTGTVTVGGSAVAVPLGTPGQNGTLTFSGTASQQVTVRMTGNTFGIITVRLLKPDGSQLTSTISGSSSFNLATQTLPTTGTYTIVVDPSGANTGTVNVSVTNP